MRKIELALTIEAAQIENILPNMNKFNTIYMFNKVVEIQRWMTSYTISQQ